MNIGIDFNTKTTKAAFLINSSNAEDCKIIEIKNTLAFVNGDVFAGTDGFNKFLIEKDSTVYELDQIIEQNGIVVDKKQISPEKCLSFIFAHLMDKIKSQTPNNDVGFICVSIPYDKYYYWHGLIEKAFSLIGIEKVRIVSQPAAFFCQPNINHLYGKINQEFLRKELQEKDLHSQTVKNYEELPWHKKFLSKKPGRREEDGNTDCLFVSVSQDNTNASLVNYGDGIIQINSTQYTGSTTRGKIENIVLDYFVSEIIKDSRNFSIKDQKTHLRILDVVNEFLRTTQSGNIFELNLPYVLCEDGEYRTLDTKIDLDALHKIIAPTFDSLAEKIKQLALKTQEVQKEQEQQIKIGKVIVIGDLFIQENIREVLSKVFDSAIVTLGAEKSLAIGAFSFSRIMTGEEKDILALEVIPFSILVRLRGGEFIEMIKKDTTVPTSREHNFEIKGEGKSKFIEVHLTTKEGNNYQSLNVWKIEVPNTKVFKVAVDIDALMRISINAHSETGQTLSVQAGNTFSFDGAGFDVGIKGKDIRQYVLNQFNYLNAVLENKEVAVFEPDESFYSMLKDGEPFKALRYLGAFLKLKSLPDVELADSKFFEEQGISGFISGSKISVPKYFTKDPHGFGYVLAHELAHYILIHEEQIILDDEQENEILTEIFVIYSGMGKLFLNGFKGKDVESSSLHAQGYLDEKIIGYIHQIYFSKFNVNLHEYKNNLTKNATKMLSELARAYK